MKNNFARIFIFLSVFASSSSVWAALGSDQVQAAGTKDCRSLFRKALDGIAHYRNTKNGGLPPPVKGPGLDNGASSSTSLLADSETDSVSAINSIHDRLVKNPPAVHAVEGQDEKIIEITDALHKANKSMPVILGDIGSGRMTTIEKLAAMMSEVNSKLPDHLKGKQLVELDVAAINADVSGAKLKAVIAELRKPESKKVLFIPRLSFFAPEASQGDRMVRVSSTGSNGLAQQMQILSSAIENGEILAISRSTASEWSTFEKTGMPLVTKSLRVEMTAATKKDSLGIAKVHAARLEKEYSVKFEDDALEVTVALASEHLKDRGNAGITAALNNAVARKTRYASKDVLHINKVDILESVAKLSAKPLEQLKQADMQDLLKLRDRLMQRIKGQSGPIQQMLDFVIAYRMGWKDKTLDSSMLTFLVLGPTGTGKSETFKLLGRFLNTGYKKMNMESLKSAEFAASELGGSGRGYVGSDKDGGLVAFAKKHYRGVFQGEEIEKAAPDALDIFLSPLADGYFQDISGTKAPFDGVVAFTSNLAKDEINRGASEKEIKDMLANTGKLKPEFLGRTKILIFNKLDEKVFEEIVRELHEDSLKRIFKEKGLVFTGISKEAVDLIVSAANPEFGARDLTDTVFKLLNMQFAKMDAAGLLHTGDEVSVFAKEDKLYYRLNDKEGVLSIPERLFPINHEDATQPAARRKPRLAPDTPSSRPDPEVMNPT